MALNATTLANEIIAAVSAVNTDFDAPSQTEVTPELIAFCQALIDHFKNNAVVETEVTSGSSAGTYQGEITE